MAETNVNDLIEILNVETRSVLNYVLKGAQPAIIDDGDKKALEVCKSSWQAEHKIVMKLIELASSVADESLVFDPAYPFVSARLNYAQALHLAGVMPAMIEAEIGAIRAHRVHVGPRLLPMVDQLIAAKEDGVLKMRALHESETAAKAKKALPGGAAQGATAAAAPAGGELGWRDADMPIGERLAAARGHTIADQLWAAMAQTDCTACGYDCEGYAKAIASGEEKDLTKCVPGESDTADALRKIMAAKK
jgi:hypothetical protein